MDVADDLLVWADEELLRIVLANLLTNAFEASGPSGTIRVVAARLAAGTSLLVSDDGPGLAIEDRARAFELLRTTKRRGSGLGLPLCQRIAVAHGGSLALLPSARGATLRLWLPDRVPRGADP